MANTSPSDTSPSLPGYDGSSPYTVVFGGKSITIRPLRASDVPLEADFVQHLSAESKRLRFFGGVQQLSAAELKLLCEVDPRTSMAFVATLDVAGKETAIGVSRYARGLRDGAHEMALTIADDWQHTPLGELLLQQLISYARGHGVKKLYTVELAENHRMRELARVMGMHTELEVDDPTEVTYSLVL